MSRPKGYKYWNKCQMCGAMFQPPNRQPHAMFCGSARQKIGCSYKNQLNLSKKWAKENYEKVKKYSREWYRKKNNILIENFRGAYKV